MSSTRILTSGLRNIATHIEQHRYHTQDRLDMVKVMFDVSKLYELTLSQLKLEQQAASFPQEMRGQALDTPGAPGGLAPHRDTLPSAGRPAAGPSNLHPKG